MHLSQRNIGIDALRMFSIAMVILGHSGTFEGSHLLAIWRMPLFFILAGSFFRPHHRGVREETTRRWLTLVIPYLVWSVVISLVVVVVKWDDPAEMLHHLYTGWRGGTGRSIFWMSSWFLLTLAISCVLLRALERFPRWVSWLVGIGGIVASRICYALQRAEVLDGHPFAELPLRLGISLPVVCYLLIGQEIRSRIMPAVTALPIRRATSIGVVLVVAPLMLASYFSIPAHYMHAGRFGWPFITPLIAVIVTIGFIMIFATGVHRVLQRWTLAGQVVGRCVRTGASVVLSHGLVILFLHHLGFASNSATDLLVRFGITLIAAFGVGLCVNLTPAARALNGVPQERPPRLTTAA